MKRLNYDLLIIFGLLFILGLGIGFYGGYTYNKCPEMLSQTVSIRDSIVPKDTTPITLIKGKPKKVKTAKFTDSVNIKVDSSMFTVNKYLDTNYYETLKFYPDSFRARATGVVSGNELIEWNFDFQNLKPDVIKIIERTNIIEKKQSLVKVYAGLYVGIALQAQTIGNYRGGVAFDAIISDRHLIGLNGGLNSFLQPEIGIRFSEKIRLRK
jgi:hypothetical protein